MMPRSIRSARSQFTSKAWSASRPCGHPADQRGCLAQVVGLSRHQAKVDSVSECVRQRQYFCRYAAARGGAVDFDDGAIHCPAGEWNIHREVTMAYSRSASAANTQNML